MNYPIFNNPQEYTTFRRGGFLTAPFKRWSEWHSLDRCLKGITDIKSVCDCPCGPGRLFNYWKKCGVDVLGVDLSDEMLAAARLLHNKSSLTGDIIKADAFHLHESLSKKPDLIASVRFCYYFDKSQRIRLLRSFAAATKKYVLAQYKTPVTLKGRLNFAKSHHKSDPKKYCSYESIVDEVRLAGLACLRIVAKGDSSDRVFVLAQKPDKNAKIQSPPAIHRPQLLRNTLLAGAVIVLALGLAFYQRGVFGDIHERQVERIAGKYQDGNDHFYVVNNSHLEDLNTSRRLSVINSLADIPALARIDKTKAEDSFFLIKEEDLKKIAGTVFWKQLTFVKKATIGKESFVLLSTEKNSNLPAIPGGASYLTTSVKRHTPA